MEKKDAELASREEQIAELKKEICALMTANVEAEKIFADETSDKKGEEGGAAGCIQHKEDGDANGSSSAHDLGNISITIKGSAAVSETKTTSKSGREQRNKPNAVSHSIF